MTIACSPGSGAGAPRNRQHARGLGLTRSQWQALAYLSRNENISQAESKLTFCE
jgi:hypothetical protein